MKHNNIYYLQLTRAIFTDEYKDLSNNAKWLFVVLNELEQRYTGKDEDFFFRTNEELAIDSRLSVRNVIRAKNELKKTDLVHIWQGHFINTKTNETSKKHFTCYRIKR